LKTETDSFVTFEGDNNVLLSQCFKQLYNDFKNGMKSQFPSRIEYLNRLEEIKGKQWQFPTCLREEAFQVIILISGQY
jgi:hypothetical protein